MIEKRLLKNNYNKNNYFLGLFWFVFLVLVWFVFLY